MDRRTLLRGGLAGAGAVAIGATVGCAPMPGRPPEDLGVWDCGVASGLHDASAAVLWTRFAPAAVAAAELDWQVAADPGFTTIVAQGRVRPGPETDGCAKVLAQDLPAGSTLWYRFAIDGLTSPTGRTRVPAAGGTAPGGVRLAVASCQSWSAGWYQAWRAIAAEDLDAVVHVGDYIYESGGGGSGPLTAREDPTDTATDLEGYRAKYRLYRSDADLRAAHAAHAFAPVWDDHEFVNDCNRLSLVEQPQRAADAYRAWFEYQPVWRIDGDRIHRRLRFGDLVDLSLLDTRQYRDPQPTGPGDSRAFLGSTADGPLVSATAPDRTILGVSQRDWLLDGLGVARDDGVRWKLIGNQVMISPIRALDLDEPAIRALVPDLPRHAGVYINFDDWDGYQAERDVLTSHLRDSAIDHVAFLTGDVHSFWQSDVLADYDEPGSPVVAQEFTCGSISSRGVDYAGDLAIELGRAARGTRPGFRYTDFTRRGYGVVDCRADAASVEFRTVRNDTPTAPATPTRRVRFDWPAGAERVTATRRP